MNRSLFLGFGLAGALALAAQPAAAQHRREGGENRGGGGNAAPRAEQRSEPRGERAQQQQPQAQPRAESRPAQPPSQQPRVEQRQAQPRYGEQRAVPREEYRRENRPEYRGDSRGDYRGDYRATPRTYAAPRYVGPRAGAVAPRYYTGRYYGPRYVGPRVSYAPRRFYRPYYVFRPRFSIAFGIWAGYPITYYDPFYYPYDYYPYAGGAVPPPASVAVQPQANMGGVSFDINPSTAEVWVDGNYYGTVDQFTASSQPLGLPAGRHHIELREPGYQVSSFDLDIIAGQVIPFQGQLEP
jgi:hypothetical protein